MRNEEREILTKLDQCRLEYRELMDKEEAIIRSWKNGTRPQRKYLSQRLEGIETLRNMFYKQFSGSLNKLHSVIKWTPVPFTTSIHIEITCPDRVVMLDNIETPKEGFRNAVFRGKETNNYEFSLPFSRVETLDGFLNAVAGNENLMVRLFGEHHEDI